MKFENLIYRDDQLDGKTIKHARIHGNSLVLTTSDNQFAVVAPDIDEDDDYHVRLLSPNLVFNYLRRDGRMRYFLKQTGVIDFDEFEKLVMKDQSEKKKKAELAKVENEKRLLAELKAKYENQ